jgi:hypothetical protein
MRERDGCQEAGGAGLSDQLFAGVVAEPVTVSLLVAARLLPCTAETPGDRLLRRAMRAFLRDGQTEASTSTRAKLKRIIVGLLVRLICG